MCNKKYQVIELNDGAWNFNNVARNLMNYDGSTSLFKTFWEIPGACYLTIFPEILTSINLFFLTVYSQSLNY